jgi:hypothetical protein
MDEIALGTDFLITDHRESRFYHVYAGNGRAGGVVFSNQILRPITNKKAASPVRGQSRIIQFL